MGANTSVQTTTHSGQDSSATKSQRENRTRQQGENHSVAQQDQNRTGTDNRATTGSRKEDTKNSRLTTGKTATTRRQLVKGDATQAQSSDERSTTEHPLVVKKTLETGGGTTQTTAEDFAAQVDWEIEIAGPLDGK